MKKKDFIRLVDSRIKKYLDERLSDYMAELLRDVASELETNEKQLNDRTDTSASTIQEEPTVNQNKTKEQDETNEQDKQDKNPQQSEQLQKKYQELVETTQEKSGGMKTNIGDVEGMADLDTNQLDILMGNK